MAKKAFNQKSGATATEAAKAAQAAAAFMSVVRGVASQAGVTQTAAEFYLKRGDTSKLDKGEDQLLARLAAQSGLTRRGAGFVLAAR